MIKTLLNGVFCGVIFLSACSKQELSLEEEAEWADIQPITNQVEAVSVEMEVVSNQVHHVVSGEVEDYSALIRRMKEMDSVKRGEGETLFTGERLSFNYEQNFVQLEESVEMQDGRGTLEAELLVGYFSSSNTLKVVEAHKNVRVVMERQIDESDEGSELIVTGQDLVLDYERRFLRMEHQVKVVDQQGVLETESLMGRFSVSNTLEFVEARKGVKMESEGRHAAAETVTYSLLTGAVKLNGLAQLSNENARLSGEQIRFWLKGSRKVICEPNVFLEIISTSESEVAGIPAQEGVTEIRSNRLIYEEDKNRVEFLGNVRLRDSRAAMNCGNLQLYLKEATEIDWIEARFEVVIQTEDRKALADRATYIADESKFTLDGTPMVKVGPNIMTGDQIIFWQDTQRMVCEPNARLLLYLDDSVRQKFLKDLRDD